MVKTNWTRVFLGGILAGVVYLILLSAVTPIIFKIKGLAWESLGEVVPTGLFH